MKLKSIKNIKDLRGKRVLVRVDFNVPIKDGKVVDDFRIRAALPTIEFLRDSGAKVILISHIGRDPKETLKPVSEHLQKFIPHSFVEQRGDGSPFKGRTVPPLAEGEVVLLENLRQDPGETGNDPEFAKKLADLGDLYVNEAFAASHREHASIVGVPKFLPSYAGLQFESEIKHLGGVLENPERPFLFILGGAKFETKMPLIEKFLEIADFIFIGGALANNFFLAKGYEVGRSVVSLPAQAGKERFKLNKLLENEKLLLPEDVVAKKDNQVVIKGPSGVAPGEMIVDIGPESVEKLKELVERAKLVLWNGPLGWYEKGFDGATKKLLDTLALSKASAGRQIIIGGGDTVSLIPKSKLKLEPRAYGLKSNVFVSTGGGAMLEFLQKGTLPGIEALL